MALAKVQRSALTPNSSCTPPRATRKPVLTSSMIMTMPYLSQSARASRRNSRVAEIEQQLPMIGSMRNAAMSSP